MRALILLGGRNMKPKELLEILSVAEKLKCTSLPSFNLRFS